MSDRPSKITPQQVEDLLRESEMAEYDRKKQHQQQKAAKQVRCVVKYKYVRDALRHKSSQDPLFLDPEKTICIMANGDVREHVGFGVSTEIVGEPVYGGRCQTTRKVWVKAGALIVSAEKLGGQKWLDFLDGEAQAGRLP